MLFFKGLSGRLILVFLMGQVVSGNLIFVPAALTTLLGITADVTIGLGMTSLLTSVGLVGPFALGLWGMASFARDAMFSRNGIDDHSYEDEEDEQEVEEEEDYNDASFNHHNNLVGRNPKSISNFDNFYESSYTHYRRKRSLTEESRQIQIPVNLVDDEDLFSSIYHSDSTHCGERMICEIAAKPTRSLHADELSLLDIVKSNSKTPKKSKFYSSKLPYERALFHGRTGMSCGSLYPKCPFDGDQMLGFIRLVSDKYLLASKISKPKINDKNFSTERSKA